MKGFEDQVGFATVFPSFFLLFRFFDTRHWSTALRTPEFHRKAGIVH